MSDGFYRAFEDRHRGSRALIKSRQRVYLPFIEPLRTIYSDAEAIDLGCGRGEWLELLKESGFDAQGVDMDDGMLTGCRELGLKVTRADAIAALKALPDDSQALVSGFHLAEHLPFENLRSLIHEALRVLKPAGLLILETPNPENILVATERFYVDPSHNKPIPPQLLLFLAEYSGFAKIKIVRVQEDQALRDKAWISLSDVLAGPSPDYAIVSQKYADERLLLVCESAFSKDYGLTRDVLVHRFETQAQLVNERAIRAEAFVNQVKSSLTWRISKPFRTLARFFR